MNRRIRFRAAVLCVAIALTLGLFAFRLYKLQTSLDEVQLQMADSTSYLTTIEAARGPILDRNGTVLVTNRASYNVAVVGFVWLNGPNPTQSLLELLDLCEKLDIELVSHFPVTEEKPYEYTLDQYDSVWKGYFRTFLRSRSLDTDISAGALMRTLRSAYRVPEGLSDQRLYQLIAVRYELELRGIKGMPLDNYILAEDVTPEQLSAIIELDIPGVIVQTSTVREYKTDYASHLLGFIGSMNAEEYENKYKEQGYAMNARVGKDGVELAFEEYLHGADGQMKTTVTADGEILEQYYTKVPQPGAAVELTIDIDLQTVAAQALEKLILDLRQNGIGASKSGTDALGGAVVVQEVKTGEVLASVSYPAYPMSVFSDAEAYRRLAEDTTYYPLLDRARFGLYAPGSIYKMVTAIAAMEYAGIGPHYEVQDMGRYTKYEGAGYAPACYIYTVTKGMATHGVENMIEALRDSCNYYFYEVGLRTPTERIDFVARSLGLGEPTGSELGEYIGQRANPESKAKEFAGTNQSSWVDGDRLQAVIGQSLNQFTPLQMACYVSALANGGTRYEATYLRRVVSWDFSQLLLESQPKVASTLEISQQSLDCIREGMTLASLSRVGYGYNVDGTASAYLFDYPVVVPAKTGTAQHGSGNTSDNASFVCYAPADDPQVAIAVYVEQGAQGGNLGQVVRAILDEYFSQESRYETTSRENYVY